MDSIIEQVFDKIGEIQGFERTHGQINRWKEKGSICVIPEQNTFLCYSDDSKGGYISAICHFLEVDRTRAGQILRDEWGIDDSQFLEECKMYKSSSTVGSVESQPKKVKKEVDLDKVFSPFVKKSFNLDATEAVNKYFNDRGITEEITSEPIIKEVVSRLGRMVPFKELKEKILVPTFDTDSLNITGYHSIISDTNEEGVRKAQHGNGGLGYFFPHLDAQLTKGCVVFEGWEDAMVFLYHQLKHGVTIDFQIACTFGGIGDKITEAFMGKYKSINWYFDADDKGDKYYRKIFTLYAKHYGGLESGKFNRQRVPAVQGNQPKDFSDWYKLSKKTPITTQEKKEVDVMIEEPIFNIKQQQGTISIDFETYSEVDLIKMGLQRYARDESTKVLMCAYLTADMKQPEVWAVGEPLPDELLNINNYDRITAYNAEFEYALWNDVLVKQEGVERLDLDKLECTMALASRHGLIGTLSGVLKTIGLVNKDSKGGGLIQLFSLPKGKDLLAKMTEEEIYEKFEEFKHYCKVDVAVEVQLMQHLPFLIEEDELFAWRHTVRCNERGVKVDLKLMDELIEGRDKAFKSAQEEFKAITGIENKSPTALKKWIREKEGVDILSLDKNTVQVILSDPQYKDSISEEAKRAIVLMGQLSSKALSKVDALKKGVVGDRYHGLLRYSQAITGRWTGTGVQIHNFPRDIDSSEFCASLVNQLRHLFIPDDDIFFDTDFSSIENRVMAYVSQDTETLQDFTAGVDQYRKMAATLFHKPYEEIGKESRERQIAKSAVLGCQYGLGAKGFQARAKQDGVDISLEEAKDIVTKFRYAVPKQTKFRYALNDAAKKVVLNPMVYTRANPVVLNDTMLFIDEGFLIMLLPTGRELRYFHPTTRTNKWGTLEVQYQGAKGLEFFPMTAIINNLVQGTARDLLLEGLKILGDRVIFHIHDQYIYTKGKKLEDLLDKFPKKFYSLIKVETLEKKYFSK